MATIAAATNIFRHAVAVACGQPARPITSVPVTRGDCGVPSAFIGVELGAGVLGSESRTHGAALPSARGVQSPPRSLPHSEKVRPPASSRPRKVCTTRRREELSGYIPDACLPPVLPAWLCPWKTQHDDRFPAAANDPRPQGQEHCAGSNTPAVSLSRVRSHTIKENDTARDARPGLFGRWPNPCVEKLVDIDELYGDPDRAGHDLRRPIRGANAA
jgi:hypothetical protein